jgi:hypothetical protein
MALVVGTCTPRIANAAARRGGGRERAARTTPRLRVEADGPASAFECDTPRGVRAFGSSERCLRALCVDRNLTNAYVLDATQRLRRNPCAGIDAFERRH